MSKKLEPVGPKDVGSGNTRNRPNQAKHWCFTFNNYTEEEIVASLKIMDNKCARYIFQEEIGEECGTPHLQGYLEFKKKARPSSMFINLKRIHWEKVKDRSRDKWACIEYCSKTDTKKSGGRIWMKGINIPKPIRTITKLRPWQQAIEDLILTEPDDRSIHWYWEPTGNVGKSAMVKYLAVKHNAQICAGKAADMKFQIANYMEKNHGIWPELIVFDVPRKNLKYLSYTGIEEIKNGCFSSSKYESKMIITNPPHVLIFANMLPDMNAMSKDRWVIEKISGHTQ